MSDFSPFDPYPEHMRASDQMWEASDDAWSASIALGDVSGQLWNADETYAAVEMYQLAENQEFWASQLESASWQAYDGPVNAEGYTAYDASMGYTTRDTSLIEPSTSAASMSMISDDNASSTL